MFDNEGHYIDDPLHMVIAKPDFSGIGSMPKFKFGGQKQLTEEQRAKLNTAIPDFMMQKLYRGITLNDTEEINEIIQECIVEPFIEPLINGRL